MPGSNEVKLEMLMVPGSIATGRSLLDSEKYVVLRKIIRPALIRAKVKGKVIGWHPFRHSLATNLLCLGVAVKVAQSSCVMHTHASQWISTLRLRLRINPVRVGGT